MPGVILNKYEEEDRVIVTHSSENKPIINQQNHLLLKSEENNANAVEHRFGGAKFQGVPSPCYNCHGLTFANKRTGIYDDKEIWNILNCEYREIKVIKDILVGDIIVYFYGDNADEISHSGIVVVANHDFVSNIKIYSKILKGREIVHHPMNCPYNNGIMKYYRISHASRIKHTE